MHRLLVFGLCVAAVGHAQDCSRAAQRLHADSPSEKAWGGHLAVTCKLPGLALDIAAELERVPVVRFALGGESFWLSRSLLDSLIQLRQPLPPAVLTSIARGYPSEATILMLQYEAANQELLFEMRRSHKDGFEWMAASNALIRLHTPGFAAAVLAEIPLSHQFRVSDDGGAPGHGRGGSIGSGTPTIHAPADFPPVGLYQLTTRHLDGTQLVSDGDPAIYALRGTFEPGVDTPLIWPAEGICAMCLDHGYLAQMANLPLPELESVVQARSGIRWTDLAQVNSEINRDIAQQQTELKTVADALVQRGYLRPEELGMTLRIAIEVRDERQDKSGPLAFPPGNFVLR